MRLPARTRGTDSLARCKCRRSYRLGTESSAASASSMPPCRCSPKSREPSPSRNSKTSGKPAPAWWTVRQLADALGVSLVPERWIEACRRPHGRRPSS